MTTPRIGDTVHYTGAQDPECRHARVREIYGNELLLRAMYNDSLGYQTTRVPQEPHPHTVDASGRLTFIEGGFTPGTWHHIH